MLASTLTLPTAPYRIGMNALKQDKVMFQYVKKKIYWSMYVRIIVTHCSVDCFG